MTFFSTSVSQGGTSLMTNMPLLNKLYYPREVFPLSSMILAAIVTITAAGVLGILFLLNGYMPRGTKSVKALTADLNTWIGHWNEDPKPFVWHKTADEILDNLKTCMSRISDAGH